LETAPPGFLGILVTAIEFPAIEFCHRGTLIWICKDEDEYTTCSSAALRSDCFMPPLELIDSSLNLFVIRSVKRIGSVGPFWGVSFLYGRRHRISYDLAHPVAITLQDAKERVKAAIRRNGNRWTSTGYTLREVQDRVDAATDFQGIILALEI
jgi:hypothetical protein